MLLHQIETIYANHLTLILKAIHQYLSTLGVSREQLLKLIDESWLSSHEPIEHRPNV